MISIKHIKNWKSAQEMKEHCKHIISHSDRYTPERVFEAKRILNYNN